MRDVGFGVPERRRRGPHVGHLVVGRGDGFGRGEGIGNEGVDVPLQLAPDGVPFGLAVSAVSVELALQANDGVLVRPRGNELGRDVLGRRSLFMAAHAERLAFEQRRARASTGAVGRLAGGVADREHVVAVHECTGHPVALGPVGEVGARVLLGRRRRQPELVVLDDEDHGQLPHGCEVHGLVDVAFAGGAVADERDGHPSFVSELGGERQPVGDGKHGAEMADHAHDAVLERAEVEGAIAPGGEPVGASQQLTEQPVERYPTAGEDTEVAVQWQQPVIGMSRGDHTDGDRLLADPGEPLGEPPLAEQHEHLLVDEPRQEQCPVQLVQLLGCVGRSQLAAFAASVSSMSS